MRLLIEDSEDESTDSRRRWTCGSGGTVDSSTPSSPIVVSDVVAAAPPLDVRSPLSSAKL
jgi:hypothetical protein